MILSLLLAADENNVIGKDNALPWHLPSDLRYFKNLTWAMPVLMGRKTFESIGKPLPGRKSIVITHNRNWKQSGAEVVHSVDEAIRKAEAYAVKEIFVIGGAEIFVSALPDANRIYLTRIHHRFEGDTFFPAINESEWGMRSEKKCAPDDKNLYSHSFQVWERKQH
jgi:dihydrofolate reductase